jgi:murein L,D-transpeptidase YafK
MVLRRGVSRLNRSLPARTLLATAAIAAATALAGCNSDQISYSARALQPLSPRMVAEIEQNNMEKDSPILVRIFKEEAELEVWKQDRTGRFALLKTYPICRWSGQLGPKIRAGDRQAPEGFYDITPGLMNPNSNYYLAFNMGFPNAYDRVWGRTGSDLMVHGDCSSRGCYAMTDQQIGEIYALARDSFFGGQRSFQVQAYPFRMTPINMARHRNNPNMAFWKMLKRGYDHFAVTHLQPKVDVCAKHYVFDAEPPAGSTKPLHFNPAGRCPAYQVPQDIAQAVMQKQRRDEIQTAQLIARGTRTVPVHTSVDGGMNQVFLAGLKDKGKMRNGAPDVRALAAAEAPQTSSALVWTATSEPAPVAVTGTVAAADVPVPAPQRKTGVATAEKPSLASRIGSLFGLGSDDKARAKPSSTRVASTNPSLFSSLFSSSDKPKPAPHKTTTELRGTQQPTAEKAPLPSSRPPRTTTSAGAIHPPAEPRPKAAVASAKTHSPAPSPTTANAGAIKPQAKPHPLDQDNAPPAQTTAFNGARASSLVTGAAPVVPAGSFNSRWYGSN